MGRPTENLRNKSLHLRISEEEYNLIAECSKKANLTRTDTILAGVNLLKEKLE